MFEPPPPGRPLALRVGVLLTTVAVLFWSGSVACLWSFESRLVFQAHRSRRARADGPGLTELRTRDGLRLDAVSLPADGAAPYWILFFPPSAGSIHGGVRQDLEVLHAAGFSVFAFDYRGFGRNRGEPSESGLYDDARSAYRHLTGPLGVDPHRIILAGRSLGSAVAVELATRVPSGGLLLLSAIDSVPRVAGRIYPWAPVGLLASQRFDSMAKAPRVGVPVVQMHGLRDQMIPIAAARALFNRFPGRKMMLEQPGNHNDVGLANDKALAALRRLWR